MTPSDRPRSYRDRDASDLADKLRRPRQRPALPACSVCHGVHAYRGHDGTMQSCGFHCGKHPATQGDRV